MPNELGLPLPEGRTCWFSEFLWRGLVKWQITGGAPLAYRHNIQEGRFLTLTELEEWERAVVEAKDALTTEKELAAYTIGKLLNDRDSLTARAEKAEAEVSSLGEAIKTADPIAWQEGFKDGAKFKGEELKVAKSLLKNLSDAQASFGFVIGDELLEALKAAQIFLNPKMAEKYAALAEKEG